MYEDPANLDDINKAFNGAGNIFFFCMIVTTIFTFYLPYFIYMSIYLYTVNSFLPFAIIIAFIPSMLTMITNTKIMSKFEDTAAPIRREMDYYSASICGIEYMKETRIYGLFGYLYRLFSGSLREFNKKEASARRKVELINLGLNIISLAGYGIVILYVMYLLLDGSISPGYFAAIYAYMGLVFGIMNEIINMHLGGLSKNYGVIRNFIRFLDLKEINGEKGVMDSNPSIEIKNVSFKYPKSDHESLTDISLEIKSGETLAIVGQNGAGKTTLARLITGIYSPTQGNIIIGNLDTNLVSPECIYESVTGVFQKFQKYKMTLDDNVKISQIKKGDPINDNALETGIDIDNADIYPNGIDTMLSREFDGVDLSGGQWQRVALARGFYRDHKLIVLDEPTAAIDPLEETKIYKQFMEIAKDKTAVIITHRMGSAKLADRIVVMDNGRIDDIGTHEELMRRGGLYYEMFTAQSVWYDREAAVI
jgi:ATP-binding cassette subfamily B protein